MTKHKNVGEENDEENWGKTGIWNESISKIQITRILKIHIIYGWLLGTFKFPSQQESIQDVMETIQVRLGQVRSGKVRLGSARLGQIRLS